MFDVREKLKFYKISSYKGKYIAFRNSSIYKFIIYGTFWMYRPIQINELAQASHNLWELVQKEKDYPVTNNKFSKL